MAGMLKILIDIQKEEGKGEMLDVMSPCCYSYVGCDTTLEADGDRPPARTGQ